MPTNKEMFNAAMNEQVDITKGAALDADQFEPDPLESEET